jgi:hypothetical protein
MRYAECVKMGLSKRDAEGQLKLHKVAAESFGVLASGDSKRSETARDALRRRLWSRYRR